MSEINSYQYESARQVAALAGVVPGLRESASRCEAVRGYQKWDVAHVVAHCTSRCDGTRMSCGDQSPASGLRERGRCKVQLFGWLKDTRIGK